MSRVVVFEHLTLDGVMQAPGRPDEDRRGGFEHGGWATLWDAVIGGVAEASMGATEALLLGRRTYEDFRDTRKETWEWMDGGFFLIQRGWTRREGAEQKYLQVIGHDRTPGSEPADSITGRLYTSDGDTLAYVCELDGDTMTIWMGEKGSPAVYAGVFSADGNTIEGSWEWPGGGYKETMTRV
jgi:hypothetical protein